MVYICLPVYNEEATIGILLYKIKETMKAVRHRYEIFVLDDGSTDRSREVVKRYAQIMPINLLFHPERKGPGPSLDRFIRETSRLSKYPERDVVVTLQADFTQKPMVIPQMLKEIGAGADIVIASKFAAGSSDEGLPGIVKLSQRFIPLIIRPLYPIKGVRDYMSTFRAYRVIILKRGMRKFGDELIISKGIASATELLLNLSVFSPVVTEVPLIQTYNIRKRKSRNSLRGLVKEYFNMMNRLSSRKMA